MKIKCPYCEEEFTYYRDMQKHFVRLDHKTLPAMKYAELIFKIHEKITENETYLEKYMKEEVEQFGESEVYVSEQYESVIEELKSLLK